MYYQSNKEWTYMTVNTVHEHISHGFMGPLILEAGSVLTGGGRKEHVLQAAH
jgi:hypothetical protein